MHRIRLLLMLALLLVAAGTGCHSNNGSNPEPPITGGELPVDAAIEANDDRLPPTAEPLSTGVAGSISVSGLTIAGEDGNPLGGGQDLTRILARLIDPEDDILVERPADASGRFELTVTDELSSAKVQIEVPVVEDINFDNLPGDVVVQVVPVQLKAGSVAQLDITLSAGSSSDQPVFTPPSDPGTQFNDFVLISQLSLLDASGSKEEYYGTFYEGNFVVYDQDGDLIFEPGEDFVAEDSNTDGWFDDGDDNFFSPDSNPHVSIEGSLVAVKLAEQTITVRATSPDGTTGSDTTLLVLPFAAIEVYSNSLGFLGPLTLDQLRPGDQVYVEGSTDPSSTDVVAHWIVVFRD